MLAQVVSLKTQWCALDANQWLDTVTNFGQATADATGPSPARKNGECFKWTTSKPHRLLAFRQSGYALLTARQQPGNPCNAISKNSGLVGNYSCRQWGIIIVVDGLSD